MLAIQPDAPLIPPDPGKSGARSGLMSFGNPGQKWQRLPSSPDHLKAILERLAQGNPRRAKPRQRNQAGDPDAVPGDQQGGENPNA